MKAYSFFLDIDDTLIPFGKGVISDYTLDVIKKARAPGCKFFVNTGRPYCDIPKDIFSERYFDGICCGGDYVEYQGKPIYTAFFPVNDAKILFNALMSMDKKVDFNLGGLRNRYYIGEKKPHYSDKIYVPINSVCDLDTAFEGDKLQKYILLDTDSPNLDARREIGKYFNVIAHPTYTEGFILGHDKAFLIKKTEEILGLDHGYTVAIGDSLNDTDMLRYASVSVAMGNAPDEVKKLCSFVTDTSECDGVAKAILKLLEEW